MDAIVEEFKQNQQSALNTWVNVKRFGWRKVTQVIPKVGLVWVEINGFPYALRNDEIAEISKEDHNG